MSVDDWARREAERQYPADAKGLIGAVQIERREAHADGIVHAFSALLSDEAVEAAARAVCDEHNAGAFERYRDTWLVEGRAALQAAIDAVTKGARSE